MGFVFAKPGISVSETSFAGLSPIGVDAGFSGFKPENRPGLAGDHSRLSGHVPAPAEPMYKPHNPADRRQPSSGVASSDSQAALHLCIGIGEMHNLYTPCKLLKARHSAAYSGSESVLWWSIRKIKKLSVTARLDAFPAGVGGVPGSPGCGQQLPRLPAIRLPPEFVISRA
ncbi:hypothetical protein [Azotobacter chroococcum]|uniref:hypothetical protein n=1 Tax=Azotobacter chroococcum TaxID=353 RepID=UPI0011869CE8|nr:hypothetical protein [Azotobacter chroococcum]